jgi:hypothetical protein
MDTPSPARRSPVLLRGLAVTVALGFLVTVMCTAGGGGAEAPRNMTAQAPARDSGPADAGPRAENAPDRNTPDRNILDSERYLPATKAGPLDLGDSPPPPEPQAAPRQDAAQQLAPR